MGAIDTTSISGFLQSPTFMFGLMVIYVGVWSAVLQVMALGHMKTPAEARELIRRSYQPRTYSPRSGEVWDQAAGRRAELLTRAAAVS